MRETMFSKSPRKKGEKIVTCDANGRELTSHSNSPQAVSSGHQPE